MSISSSEFIDDIISNDSKDSKDQITLSLTDSILNTEAPETQKEGKITMSEIDRNLKKMRYRLVSDEEYIVSSHKSQKGGSKTSTVLSELSDTCEFDEDTVSLSKTISSKDTTVSDAYKTTVKTTVTDSGKLSETSIFKELGLTESEAVVDSASGSDYKNKSISVFLSETSEFVDDE